jgi:polygalacturonase
MEAAAAAVKANPSARPIVQAHAAGVYITGSFNLTSRVTLDVAPAATIMGVGSHDPMQYTVLPPLASYGVSRDDGCEKSHQNSDSEDKGVCVNRFQALVMVAFADGARIIGGGTLDGGGEFFWTNRDKQKNGRPHLVEIYNSTNTEIGGITLKDSPFWTLHPVYSKGVWIHGVNITAPPDSPNTDGIDPDSCEDVLIEGCRISCGDDHIAIKSGIDAAGRKVGMPSRNITVRGNVHLAGRGISIGSEVSGGVEGIVFSQIQVCRYICVYTGIDIDINRYILSTV